MMKIVICFVGLVLLITLYYCILALRVDKAKTIKNDLNRISLFILLGAIFDFLSIISFGIDQSLFLLLCYYTFYPIYLFLGSLFKISVPKQMILLFLFVLVWMFLSFFVDYQKSFWTKMMIPIYCMHILAIGALGYRIVTKKNTAVVNSIYYLHVGLLAIESIGFLSISNLIQFKLYFWLPFKIGYILYITLMRFIFIRYVSRIIKS